MSARTRFIKQMFLLVSLGCIATAATETDGVFGRWVLTVMAIEVALYLGWCTRDNRAFYEQRPASEVLMNGERT